MSQTRLSDYQVDLIGKYVAGQFLSGTPEYEDMLRHELSNTSASDFVVGSLPASPGYSLSTNILDHEETKVYIDICYNCNIPRPAVSDPEIFEAALKGKGDYRVPYFIQEPTLYKKETVVTYLISTVALQKCYHRPEWKSFLFDQVVDNVAKHLKKKLNRKWNIYQQNESRGVQCPFEIEFFSSEWLKRFWQKLNHTQWSPKSTFIEHFDKLWVMIPMPDLSYPDWQTILKESGLELMLGEESFFISFTKPVNHLHSNNRFDFYKKSRMLVGELTLLNKEK